MLAFVIKLFIWQCATTTASSRAVVSYCHEYVKSETTQDQLNTSDLTDNGDITKTTLKPRKLYGIQTTMCVCYNDPHIIKEYDFLRCFTIQLFTLFHLSNKIKQFECFSY